MKNTLLFCFYLLGGVVMGGMLAHFCTQVPFLQWAAYSHSIGINPDTPVILDLSVLKVTFGFWMNVSVAQVLSIGAAMFLYSRCPLR